MNQTLLGKFMCQGCNGYIGSKSFAQEVVVHWILAGFWNYTDNTGHFCQAIKYIVLIILCIEDQEFENDSDEEPDVDDIVIRNQVDSYNK